MCINQKNFELLFGSEKIIFDFLITKHFSIINSPALIVICSGKVAIKQKPLDIHYI